MNDLSLADSTEVRQRIIRDFIRDCSAMEMKWVVRIILKDLKIGLKHDRVRLGRGGGLRWT